MHWLQIAAERVSLSGLEGLSLAPDTPTAEVWEQLERATALSSKELAMRLAPSLRLAPAALELVDPSAERLLTEKLARRYHVHALRQDARTITLATANPTDLDAEQAICFATGKRVIFELAAFNDIANSLNATFEVERTVEKLLENVDGAEAESVRILEDIGPEVVSQRDVDAAPIVRLTSHILHEAVVQRASDIHVEPGVRSGIVRFRVDGVMRQYLELPSTAVTRIVSRIKVLAKLDIADRMRPQDGRARIQVGGTPFDLRIATVPTRDAEKAVVRILRPDELVSLDDLGLSGRECATLRQLLAARDGLIVITGPTGSGKTTTLYGAIREIANGQVNVMTVEDPVEYELAGITQLQVDLRKGLTFASALRSILRQDPDVILVGEIRDAETAAIAVQAAMTGHLVLATLHTGDAMSIVTRLTELGLDRATIASVLRGSVAQRLVRRVCPHCATPIAGVPDANEARLAEQYGVTPGVRATGCARCAGAGYLGRLPVLEVAVMTPLLSEQITAGWATVALERSAIAQGMLPIRSSALDRIVSRETTLQEVDRVLGETAAEFAHADRSAPDRISTPLDTEVFMSNIGLLLDPPVAASAPVPAAVAPSAPVPAPPAATELRERRRNRDRRVASRQAVSNAPELPPPPKKAVRKTAARKKAAKSAVPDGSAGEEAVPASPRKSRKKST